MHIEAKRGTWAFGSLPARMELVWLCVSTADIGGDRSSAVSQAVVASGRNSPSNLLRLQPRNQKVCSAPRQGRLHPGWSRKGQGEGRWLPCRGVGAAGMGRGWGTEPRCSQKRRSAFRAVRELLIHMGLLLSHSKALEGVYCASIVTAQPSLHAR